MEMLVTNRVNEPRRRSEAGRSIALRDLLQPASDQVLAVQNQGISKTQRTLPETNA